MIGKSKKKIFEFVFCNLFNECKSMKKLQKFVTLFLRIHYPLPLEYCGPPDPSILQATIKKLENDLQDAREAVTMCTTKKDLKEIYELQKRFLQLTGAILFSLYYRTL